MQYIGYLGPEGSFSEEALFSYLGKNIDFEANSAKITAFSTIPKLLVACEQREISWAFVPIENSSEGQVGVTMDTLACTESLFMYREVVHPITHCLLTPRPLALGNIERVYSHEQALGQCRDFLESQLHNAQQVVCSSTAEAAKKIAAARDNWAAVGPKRAAKLYQLHCQVEGIQSQTHNETRFGLIGHQVGEMTGDDKTSLLVKTEDKPGALYRVLRELAEREINLTRIESRPSKQRLGEYIFFIDLDGHAFSNMVQDALWALRDKKVEVRLLGTYPKAKSNI